MPISPTLAENLIKSTTGFFYLIPRISEYVNGIFLVKDNSWTKIFLLKLSKIGFEPQT